MSENFWDGTDLIGHFIKTSLRVTVLLLNPTVSSGEAGFGQRAVPHNPCCSGRDAPGTARVSVYPELTLSVVARC